jgi:hypothetical protein
MGSTGVVMFKVIPLPPSPQGSWIETALRFESGNPDDMHIVEGSSRGWFRPWIFPVNDHYSLRLAVMGNRGELEFVSKMPTGKRMTSLMISNPNWNFV